MRITKRKKELETLIDEKLDVIKQLMVRRLALLKSERVLLDEIKEHIKEVKENE